MSENIDNDLRKEPLTSLKEQHRIMHGIPGKAGKLYINVAFNMMNEAEADCRFVMNGELSALNNLGENLILMESLTEDFDGAHLDTLNDITFSDKYVDKLEELFNDHKFLPLYHKILNSLRLIHGHHDLLFKYNRELDDDIYKSDYQVMIHNAVASQKNIDMVKRAGKKVSA